MGKSLAVLIEQTENTLNRQDAEETAISSNATFRHFFPSFEWKTNIVSWIHWAFSFLTKFSDFEAFYLGKRIEAWRR